MRSFVLLLCISYVAGEASYVNKKFCRDVDQSQCTIHNVIVDPCTKGSTFCAMKRNKNYVVTLDVVPRFSASKLKLSISGDVDNSGNFTTIVKAPSEACHLLYCPLEAGQRRIFDASVALDKRAMGKFPLQVKLWNEDDESKACCVTFTVKVK